MAYRTFCTRIGLMMARQGIEPSKRPMTVLAFKRFLAGVEEAMSFRVVSSGEAWEQDEMRLSNGYMRV